MTCANWTEIVHLKVKKVVAPLKLTNLLNLNHKSRMAMNGALKVNIVKFNL